MHTHTCALLPKEHTLIATQKNLLCVLFHQEVRKDHQSLGLPEEQRQVRCHTSCTGFKNTLLNWHQEIVKCWGHSTLVPDCPGMPLAPSAPERPCEKNNGYITGLLKEYED